MKLLEKAIYLVILGLPLYLVRFRLFGLPTNLLEIIIYILFLGWFLFLRQVDKPIVPRNYWWPLALILTGLTLATIFSINLRVSAGIWKGWFIDPFLFLVVLTATLKKAKAIKGAWETLFLSGLLVAIISLVYLVLGKLGPSGRLQAFFNSPNYLAIFLSPALIWGVLRLKEDEGIKRLVRVIALLVLLVVILLTQSYGAWLGLLIVIATSVIIFLFKNGRKKEALLALGLTLLIIITLLSLKIAINNQGRISVEARLLIWQESFKLLKTKFLIGIGPGTFDSYFLPYPEWQVPQPHNLYLAFALQTGLLGLVGFIWLLFAFFKDCFRKIKKANQSIQLSLMLIMVYFLAHGLVDTTYWKNDLALIFWLTIGTMIALVNL